MKVKSLSHVRLLATPWTAAYQAPASMGFSRQEYWSGVPLPLRLNKYYVCKCPCSVDVGLNLQDSHFHILRENSREKQEEGMCCHVILDGMRLHFIPDSS